MPGTLRGPQVTKCRWVDCRVRWETVLWSHQQSRLCMWGLGLFQGVWTVKLWDTGVALLWGIVDRLMAPPKMSCPNPQNLCMCDLTWQEGLQIWLS